MLIQVFFWITIVFIAIERIGLSKVIQPLTKKKGTWTPDDLGIVKIIPKKKAISKGDVVLSFIWTAIWAIVYFNADHFAGIYRSVESDGLQFVMPLFNQDTLLSYWPIMVAFIILEIGLAVYKWKASQWNMKLALVNAVIHLLSAVTFIIIANNPKLLNQAIIPYMVKLFETTTFTAANFINVIWWFAVGAVVATILIEVCDSFRKARIK